jgi:hypothetical protein
MIALAYRDSLPEGTANEFDQLVQGLTGMLYQQHNPDGGHTNITADSLSINPPNLTTGVDGTITFQDRLGKKTVFSRDDSGTIITLNNGTDILIRRTDVSGAILNLVRVGLMRTSGPGFGNGITLLAIDAATPTAFHDWGLASGNTNVAPGARMLISDLTTLISPVSLRYRSSATTYEWMKTTGSEGPTTEQVTLGSGFDSSQQGYWDAAYIKSLSLATGSGSAEVAGKWNDVAYNTANYSGSGSLTWTPTGSGDQVSYAYMVLGNTMWLTFEVQGNLGGSDSSELRLAVPGGYTITGRRFGASCAWAVDNNDSTLPIAPIQAEPGHQYISIQKIVSGALANWIAGGNLAYVNGQIAFSIA